MLTFAGAMPPSRPNSLTPKRWQTLSPRGWANGGPGSTSPLAGGLGDVPPKAKGGGELPTLATPPRVGPKTPANPQQTGVGNGGSRGRKPPGGGLWGVSPHKTKRGGELPTPATPLRVGPKTLANPKPTRVGKWGVQGAAGPLAGGCGGAPPHKDKRGNELPTLANPPRVGPKTQANPQPTGVGKRGSRGLAPWRGAVGGVPPQRQKR